MQGNHSGNSSEYTRKNQLQEVLLFAGETIALCHLKIKIAKLVCYLIPVSCPFARDISFFGQTIQIPPMCKLNPFYNYLMKLRWRALKFLHDMEMQNI